MLPSLYTDTRSILILVLMAVLQAAVKVLLARNADTTLATALEQGQGGGGFGFAPLHAAVQAGSVEIVAMLLEHGVPAGMVTTDNYEWSGQSSCQTKKNPPLKKNKKQFIGSECALERTLMGCCRIRIPSH